MHGTTSASVLISYPVNKGVVVLPKSISPQRIATNLQTVRLSAEALERLDALAAGGQKRRTNKPDWGSDLGFEDWF